MDNQPEDVQYGDVQYVLSELPHAYGERVHIFSDPWLMSQLVRLCAPQTVQPAVNELVSRIYTQLVRAVASAVLPRRQIEMPTRMIESTPRGCYRGAVIDPETRVVVVNMVRAGTLPSLVCYTEFNLLLNPAGVRQDHVLMQRTVGDDDRVTGAAASGQKIGGDVADAVMVVPDPMGATGGSMIQLLEMYRREVEGRPRKMIALHLIVTPEYIKAVQQAFPEVEIYAARLDRGLSSPEVLQSLPGERWDEEVGLTATQYIVPGGGGFGEIMNNTPY